ncbi:peptidase M3A and M3B domain-containing protein [Heterostelium album PN500]|uniref:Peptidase M3A and M3B domain-containing protein n=1 Tax=Heterostelium pallidum (strain ATCC 26659 / Pp 5 / PN500) TaxID=670386 RepID=D3BBB4_HETP5|nr:peptidase M3A and M3B domain-containing protein [Heterostelium album PN500]EFA81321.1 peptidase M3A and M3B domain-containing protein [Heterostelium album PN500]|eukprot:XP_020433439.1 peptidase M3A and M3B domain-containing protein [Heterostelium album PN500]
MINFVLKRLKPSTTTTTKFSLLSPPPNSFITSRLTNNNNFYLNNNNNNKYNNNNFHFNQLKSYSTISNSTTNNNNNNLKTTTTTKTNKMSDCEKIKNDIKLKFPLKLEEFDERVQHLKKTHDAGLQKIIDIPRASRTFENTFGALIDLERQYYIEESSLTFPAHVNQAKEIRDVSNNAESELNKYSIDTNMREDLYNVFAEYIQDNPAYKSELSAVQQRVIKKIMEVYERNGLQLPKDQRDVLKEIKKEINELSIQFNKNIAEDKSKVTFTREQLAGVPDDVLELFEKTDSGSYTVSCKSPEYVPLMKFCNVTDTRKKMDFTYGSRCIDTNVKILSQACKLRHESAKILGKNEWSEVVTQYNMALNSKNVTDFLTRMTNLLKPYGLEELKKLA